MIACTVCGSTEWIACSPGTAPDAKAYDLDKLVNLRPAEDVPLQAWCAAHIPAIEALAKRIYDEDGFNFACLPLEQAWPADRENVRERYRAKARAVLAASTDGRKD